MSRKKRLFKRFLDKTSRSCLWLLPCIFSYPAFANPEGASVVAGEVRIEAQGPQLSIHQSSDRAIIDWRSFDIGQNEQTQFYQPSSSSWTLNRIGSQSASQILGNLTANGHIILVNPHGVFFGKDSVVDVGGLIASTADIQNTDFLKSQYRFNVPGKPDGLIVNQGRISFKEAGLGVLVAPSVKNQGVIKGRLGKLTLASGDVFTLDLYGDQLIRIGLQNKVKAQLIEQKGLLELPGGEVLLTSAAARDVVDSFIDISGEIKAQTVEQKNGRIIIKAEGSEQKEGRVILTGKLDASGQAKNDPGGTIHVSGRYINHTADIKADGSKGGDIIFDAKNVINQGKTSAQGQSQGGNIHINYQEQYLDNSANQYCVSGQQGGFIGVTGDTGSRLYSSGQFESQGETGGHIQVLGGNLYLFDAKINASGTALGGEILVGGDYQGQGNIFKSERTTVNTSSHLKADGQAQGGKIVVWSEQETQFLGELSAAGRAPGLIEVSSHDKLGFNGRLSPTAGKQADLLLDPQNITISTAAISQFPQFNFANPSTNLPTSGYGLGVAILGNGNIVIASSNDNVAASAAGAVYLFNGSNAALISTLTGSHANDQIGSGITKLTGNNNYAVESPFWNGGIGAVTWGNGSTGITGVVSSSNSLVGSTANDSVGLGGITALSNGNYGVASPNWNGAIGAATWGSGSTGTTGIVSSSNSLVGSTANDNVGLAITALSNGHYVVASPNWNGAIGAATWGNGSTGTTGTVSSSNSLVGSTSGDSVCLAITALSNGNYGVASPNWNGNTGAATWGNGSTGTTGTVSSSNSLVGSTANDQVGSTLTVLTNGNYVVASPNWNGVIGAATWGSGTTGITGIVSSSNSLVGSTAGDSVGSAITALSNGNYGVASPNWNGAIGAATWGNGSTGTTGVVSSSNSLVGSTAGDSVGSAITALSNGNYVVASPNWNGTIGAATWGNGSTGTTGTVSSSNSLVGSTANDTVGLDGITALNNGNYVVASPDWNGGIGAATWGSGTTGITGIVSSSNSLVGSTAGDSVGTTLTALSNGNYGVASPNWNGFIGAATWGNGSTGTTGTVSSSNSLVGSTAGDQVSASGITALSNGNYVVASSFWTGGIGAATWGNGSMGITGTVSSSNSLVGSIAGDSVGTAMTVLSNGNYVVASPFWNGGIGSATWGSGIAGVTGTITAANSLLGASANTDLRVAGEDTVNGNFLVAFLLETGGGRVTAGPTNGAVPYASFSSYGGYSSILAPSVISNALNGNVNISLQASNDITVSNAITATTSNSATLTLQAGRSILINANITTDNGNLVLTANDTTADGVVDMYRSAGAAAITQAAGTTLNTGTGNLSVTLKNGAGKTNLTSGNITLDTVDAQNIAIQNDGPSNGSNILMAQASSLITANSVSLNISNAANTTGTLGTSGMPIAVTTTDVNAAAQGGNIYLKSPIAALNLGGATLGGLTGVNSGNGNLVVTSAGAITDSQALMIGGTSSLTTTAGNAAIHLTQASSYTGAVSLNTNGTGNATLTGVTSPLILASTTIGGNLTASSAGAISDSGALTVTGKSLLTTTAGNAAINLTQASSYTGSVSLNTNGTGNATLTGVTSGLSMGNSTVGGNLVVSSAGAVSGTGAVKVTGTSSYTTTAGNAAINLTGASSYTGAVTLAPNGSGNATLIGITSPLTLASTTIGGNLTTSSAGVISDNGALTVTGASSFMTTAGNAAINLTKASSYTGAVSLNTNGTGNAILTGVASALNIGSSAVRGNLTASSAGAISDSGALTITGASSFTTTAGNAAINLIKSSSYTGAVSLNTNGTGNATLTGATSALNLGASTIGGNLVVSGAGAILDSGALAVAGTSSFATTAGNSAITLDSASRYTGAVYLNTQGTGNGTIQNVLGNLTLGGPSVIGGNLSIILAGDFAYTPAQLTVGGTTYIRSANINIPPLLLLINQPLITPVLEDEIFLVTDLNFNTSNNNILGLTKTLNPAVSFSTANNQFTVLDFFLHAEAVPSRYTRVNANNELSQEQEANTVHL